MIEGLSAKDIAVGTALSCGSALAQLVRPLGRAVGGDESVNTVALRWRLSPLPVTTVTNWYAYDGNAEAGRTPRDYPEAAVLSIDNRLLEQFVDVRGARPVVAYALGQTAFMIGSAPRGVALFAPSETDPNHSVVAMRIGQGVLKATAGIYTAHQTLITDPALVQGGQRYRLADVPAGVPIV